MRMDKLTSKFQMALAEAQSLAVGLDHQFIEPAHVMVALLDQEGGMVRGLLTKSGANVNLLRSQLGEALDRLPKVEGTGGEIHIGSEVSNLLNLTERTTGILSSKDSHIPTMLRPTILAASTPVISKISSVRTSPSPGMAKPIISSGWYCCGINSSERSSMPTRMRSRKTVTPIGNHTRMPATI